MASQLTQDEFFAIQINFTNQSAARLNKRTGIDSQQLMRLSAAEVTERYAAIQSEIDMLGRILRRFLIGLVFFGLLIVLATSG